MHTDLFTKFVVRYSYTYMELVYLNIFLWFLLILICDKLTRKRHYQILCLDFHWWIQFLPKFQRLPSFWNIFYLKRDEIVMKIILCRTYSSLATGVDTLLSWWSVHLPIWRNVTTSKYFTSQSSVFFCFLLFSLINLKKILLFLKYKRLNRGGEGELTLPPIN